MRILSKKLIKEIEFEKRIEDICSFNNAKCEIKQGKILNIKDTNIAFIEPHKINISIKGKNILLLYFNKNNLFLYNRSMPITVAQLTNLLKELKEC